MKNIPENCLTCKFMDFVDDELEELRCFYQLKMRKFDEWLDKSPDWFFALISVYIAILIDWALMGGLQ